MGRKRGQPGQCGVVVLGCGQPRRLRVRDRMPTALIAAASAVGRTCPVSGRPHRIGGRRPRPRGLGWSGALTLDQKGTDKACCGAERAAGNRWLLGRCARDMGFGGFVVSDAQAVHGLSGHIKLMVDKLVFYCCHGWCDAGTSPYPEWMRW